MLVSLGVSVSAQGEIEEIETENTGVICTPNGFGVLLLLPFNSTADQVIPARIQSSFESHNKKEIKRYYFYAFKAVVDPASFHNNCKSYP